MRRSQSLGGIRKPQFVHYGINGASSGAAGPHNHDDRYPTDAEVAAALATLQPAGSYVLTGNFTWANLNGKPSTFAPSAHNHAFGEIPGLQTALDGKQPSGNYAAATHTHDAAYAPIAHSHTVANVTGLQAALDGKQAAGSYALSGHNHDAAYAAVGHNHSGVYEPVIAAGQAGQYWAGNKTWQTLPSGGADPWTYRKLAADYTNATATFANVSDGTTVLQWTPPANSDWELEGRILIWTTAAANLPRVGFNVAGNAANGYGAVNLWQAGATATTAVQANVGWNNNAAAINAQMAAGGVLAANTPYVCEVIAAGRSGNSPQAMTVQLACETAAANVCFAKRGSFIRYRTI